MTATEAPALQTVRNPYCRHGDIHSFCPYSPEQEAFSESTEYELFWGGAAGGGKSILLLNEGLRQVHIPGYRAIFFRRTYDELAQVIEMSHETFPNYGGRYNKANHMWRFPHRQPSAHHRIMRSRDSERGASYRMAYCARDDDRYHYQGGAFAYIAWDELTQYPTDVVYTFLFLRCRPLWQGQGVRCYIRAASNPGGPGMMWVKERFIEGRESGVSYTQVVEDPLTGAKHQYERKWILATLDSNDILLNTTNYEMSILAHPDPEIRRAMRHGDWNISAGAMFAELRDGLHRVAQRPPLDWTRKEIAIDWAYGGFAVAGWFETTSGLSDAQPHSWLYREHVRTKLIPPMFAQELTYLTADEEQIERVVMDSAMWDTPQTGGPSPAEQMLPKFHARGWKVVPVVKGAGSRVRGWQLLHTYFFPRRFGGPLLRVMDNCPVAWRQLTTLARGVSPHDVEDIEPHQTDDAADMVRYWAQGRPRPAMPTPAEILMDDADLDKMVDPVTYEAAKIEQMRQVGFPAVRLRRQLPERTTRRPWT